MGLPSPSVTVVAVAPTSTEVFSVDVRDEQWLTAQVTNLDATQTFAGVVERRVSDSMAWATSSLVDFGFIPPAGTVDASGAPLDSVSVDLDVTGTGFLRVVGVMNGAGGNVAVCVRKGQRK